MHMTLVRHTPNGTVATAPNPMWLAAHLDGPAPDHKRPGGHNRLSLAHPITPPKHI